MAFLRENQLTISLVLLIICAVNSILIYFRKSLPVRRRIIVSILQLSVVFLLLADHYAYIFRGNETNLGWWMVRISNFGIFYFSISIIFMFNLYLKQIIKIDSTTEKPPRKLFVCDIFLGISLLLLIISLFTNMYYSFDETNHYHRAQGQIICYLFLVSVLFLQLVCILQNFKTITLKLRILLIIFTLVPIIAAVLQIFMYGLSIINISFGILAIFLFLCEFFGKNAASSAA